MHFNRRIYSAKSVTLISNQYKNKMIIVCGLNIEKNIINFNRRIYNAKKLH